MKHEPAVMVMQGLRKERPLIPGMQIIVFMALYNQFPYRYKGDEGGYFRPNEKGIARQLKISMPVYYFLVNRIKERNLIFRRKAREGGFEYRINFEKIRVYLKEVEDA